MEYAWFTEDLFPVDRITEYGAGPSSVLRRIACHNMYPYLIFPFSARFLLSLTRHIRFESLHIIKGDCRMKVWDAHEKCPKQFHEEYS